MISKHTIHSESWGGGGCTYNNDLRYDVYLLLVLLQTGQRLVDIRARPLDDERAKVAKDMFEVLLRPDSRCAHGLYEVRASEQSYAHRLLVAVHVLAATKATVYLMVEVVEDLCGGDVFGLDSLPRVACQPVGGSLGGEGAHLCAVLGGRQAKLLVGGGHRREEAADDFKIGVETSEVGGHLEHAQVEECDGAAEAHRLANTQSGYAEGCIFRDGAQT